MDYWQLGYLANRSTLSCSKTVYTMLHNFVYCEIDMYLLSKKQVSVIFTCFLEKLLLEKLLSKC